MTTDDKDAEKVLVPENVTAEHAEIYLRATGWVPFLQDGKWVPPVGEQTGAVFTRGEAVKKQFKSDALRLVFVFNHGKRVLLEAILIKPVWAVIEGMLEEFLQVPEIQEAMSRLENMPEVKAIMDKFAEKKSTEPAN